MIRIQKRLLWRRSGRLVSWSKTGRSKGPLKAFEVRPDKQIVWRYSGPHRVHEIQILTNNGQPIAGEPLK